MRRWFLDQEDEQEGEREGEREGQSAHRPLRYKGCYRYRTRTPCLSSARLTTSNTLGPPAACMMEYAVLYNYPVDGISASTTRN